MFRRCCEDLALLLVRQRNLDRAAQLLGKTQALREELGRGGSGRENLRRRLARCWQTQWRRYEAASARRHGLKPCASVGLLIFWSFWGLPSKTPKRRFRQRYDRRNEGSPNCAVRPGTWVPRGVSSSRGYGGRPGLALKLTRFSAVAQRLVD